MRRWRARVCHRLNVLGRAGKQSSSTCHCVREDVGRARASPPKCTLWWWKFPNGVNHHYDATLSKLALPLAIVKGWHQMMLCNYCLNHDACGECFSSIPKSFLQEHYNDRTMYCCHPTLGFMRCLFLIERQTLLLSWKGRGAGVDWVIAFIELREVPLHTASTSPLHVKFTASTA